MSQTITYFRELYRSRKNIEVKSFKSNLEIRKRGVIIVVI